MTPGWLLLAIAHRQDVQVAMDSILVLSDILFSSCWRLCIKTSDDGGKTWTKIRSFNEPYGTEGQILYDRVSRSVLLQFPDRNLQFRQKPGAILQIRSIDGGETWSAPVEVNLGSLFAPFRPIGLSVGPGAGIQLSATNRYHANRLLFAGHHGPYQYDMIWYSDDMGHTWTFAQNAPHTNKPAQLWQQDEIALAETPDGGVLASMRNEVYHGKGLCNCRGLARSSDGGSTFGPAHPALVLVGPICEASMLSLPTKAGGRAIFHANPGHGTDTESKSPPNGRASGTVRRSIDGGVTWEASVRLNGNKAFAYSCLTHVPQTGFIGLAFETVLPGSDISAKASANNIIFTLVPQNFSSDSRTEMYIV